MKSVFILVSFVLLYSTGYCQSDLNVMTFNIRYNTPNDSLNAWSYRKDHVAEQVLFHDIDLLGVQEALNEQMLDLKQRLKGYEYVGVGRNDGKIKGEYSAIFYNTKRLKLIFNQTFWLSQTPTIAGSKGWDAAITRLVTVAKFIDRKTGRTFFAFNTHFDHIGKEARRESAKLLLAKVKEIAGSTPSVITGDFNATKNDEPIQVILDENNPDHLQDSKKMSVTGHYGPEGTFTAFGNMEKSDLPIDHIFLKGKWLVKKHATISESWQGRFASDHFSVMTVLAN